MSVINRLSYSGASRPARFYTTLSKVAARFNREFANFLMTRSPFCDES